MTTSFDDYVRELEARCTDEERTLLDEARARCRAQLESAERKIERRERIDRYVARMVDEYGLRQPPVSAHSLGREIVTLHEWPSGLFNHDGPCVEIAPRKCDGMRFTTLLLKAEIWGEDKNGKRITADPVQVKGHTDDEIIANFISYINGWTDTKENA